MTAGKPQTATDEATCDVRFGQVGLANIRILATRPEQLREELARRVQSAPALFERTAVVMDLSHLAEQPDDDSARGLLEAIRAAGMLPVGVAYGSPAMDELAGRLGLPTIARFREAYEQNHAQTRQRPPEPVPQAPARQADTRIHDQQIRSGQQHYARDGDLVVTATVANGAEIIADGSIHVYGTLRGRALAGAQGNEQARIFCSDFRAQLVSIAGRYQVFEELPEDYAGQAVQCWLEGDQMHIELLQGKNGS